MPDHPCGDDTRGMVHGHPNSDLATRPFRIWVVGRLDRSFSEGLPGIEQKDVPGGTMLSGAALDQSHLHSTLDLLRNLGIEVLRFEVDPPSTDPARES